MQTKFAVIEFYNSELAARSIVLVTWCGKHWVAGRISNGGRYNIALRLSGQHEPRMANIPYGKGELSNLDAADPTIEMAMLLRRHGVLLNRAVSYDEPADWKAITRTTYTLAELERDPSLANGMVGNLARLWSTEADTWRVERVLAQRWARLGLNGYVGVIAEPGSIFSSQPGITWRGVSVLALPNVFTRRRTLFADLGKRIAVCATGEHNDTHDYDEAHAEAVGMVIEGSLNGDFTPSQTERVMDVLNGFYFGETVVLAHCGHVERERHQHRVYAGGDYRLWCNECFNEDSVVVEDLNERWARDDAFYSDSREAYYSVDPDEDEDERERSEIMSYTTNVLRVLRADPKIKSSHYGDFLMGIELEMTSGDDYGRTKAAHDVRGKLGRDYCIVKADGSLPDNGFEVVTAPRGLAEHIKRFSEWEVKPQYRAWDVGSCGLHVHVHSYAFTELTLGKYLMFINRDENAPFLRRLAGRHPFKDSQAARYCAQENMMLLDNPKAAVKGKSKERYRMVNTQNLSAKEAQRLGINPGVVNGKYDTIELRIFRASLKKERLLAQIEFSHAVVMFCRVASYRDLSEKSFLKWLASVSKLYPNLANWYGVRKSLAIKNAGGKPLEEVCPDKVLGSMTVPDRLRAAPVSPRW